MGEVRIIEYLCHACGKHAMDVSTHSDEMRRWVCPCGQSWTGGKVSQTNVMLAIEDRA